MMKITASMLDGTEHAAEVVHLMPTADRVAFERRFKTSAVVLAKLEKQFDADAQLKEDADLEGFREEWIAFFAWRALVRAGTGVSRDFDEFVENLAAVRIGAVEAEVEANPTEQAVPQP